MYPRYSYTRLFSSLALFRPLALLLQPTRRTARGGCATFTEMRVFAALLRCEYLPRGQSGLGCGDVSQIEQNGPSIPYTPIGIALRYCITHHTHRTYRIMHCPCPYISYCSLAFAPAVHWQLASSRRRPPALAEAPPADRRPRRQRHRTPPDHPE